MTTNPLLYNGVINGICGGMSRCSTGVPVTSGTYSQFDLVATAIAILVDDEIPLIPGGATVYQAELLCGIVGGVYRDTWPLDPLADLSQVASDIATQFVAQSALHIPASLPGSMSLVTDSALGAVNPYPVGESRIFWSDGTTPGGLTTALSESDVTTAIANNSIILNKLKPSGNIAKDTINCASGTTITWVQRVIGIHEVEANTIALYNFTQQNLNDSGPLSLPALTVALGTARYGYIYQSLGSFWFDSQTLLYLNSAVSQLRILGALTVEFIMRLRPVGSANYSLISHAASGDTEPANILYSMNLTRNLSGVTQEPVLEHEHGAGVNDTFNVANNIPFEELTDVVFTRTSGGVYQLYINGRPWGPASAALTLPTDGSSGRLCLSGYNSGSIGNVCGHIANLQILNITRSAADVMASYNTRFGPVFGRIT